MKKLGIMTALLLSAGSAFAGDFEAAQNAGFDSTKGPATLIALVLTIIGAGVWWLWKNWNRTKLPLAISAIAVATMLSLQADVDTISGYGYNNNMWSRFTSWFGGFWTSQFSWENGTASFGKFTPVPSAPPNYGWDGGRDGKDGGQRGGNGSTPPRQQN